MCCSKTHSWNYFNIMQQDRLWSGQKHCIINSELSLILNEHRARSRCSSRMWAWTKPGRNVQTLSKLCSKFVQGLSKLSKCPNFVHALSIKMILVQCLSSLYLRKYLSNSCQDCPNFLPLDKPWTRLCPGFIQTLSIKTESLNFV